MNEKDLKDTVKSINYDDINLDFIKKGSKEYKL